MEKVADLAQYTTTAFVDDLNEVRQWLGYGRINLKGGIDSILAMGLNFSVTCAEDLPFITEEMTRRETAGTYLGDYRVRQQKALCEVWPRGKATACMSSSRAAATAVPETVRRT